MIKIKTQILEKLRSPKVLVIAGLCGILLIFLSGLSSDKETKEVRTNEFSFEEYRLSIEEGIEKIVKDITGSGKVQVVVTLESSVRYNYAESLEETKTEKNEKESQSSDNELKEGYITVKTADGGEEALLVTARMPEIRGIAIVCEGGDNEIINQKIQNAVMAALNITSKRVYICGRK